MRLVVKADTGAGSEELEQGRTIIETCRPGDALDRIDDLYRGAQVEAIVADGDGLVISFRGDAPDLFVKPLVEGKAEA
jgi:hypothetical protein